MSTFVADIAEGKRTPEDVFKKLEALGFDEDSIAEMIKLIEKLVEDYRAPGEEGGPDKWSSMYG